MSAGILVTGGTGYIGSHTLVELLNAGFKVTALDNLANSTEESLRRVEKITGKTVPFLKVDLVDEAAVEAVFAANKYDAVIHFAGLKAVGESVKLPLLYYQNNISGTVSLLKAMGRHGCKNIVFSSSATVYGDPASVPVDESFPNSATNPYGRTKLFIEQILQDMYKSDNEWNIALLRYFNPVGAHASGLMGEDPKGIPNNLMPFVQQVAAGIRPKLSVFGNDYPTHDGTGVRDYIHVVDLALGHVAAVRKLTEKPGAFVVNLGTGTGYSVLDMVKAFEKASGKTIPYEIAPRRPGDVAVVYADTTKAKDFLGWEAERGLEDMCASTWKWVSDNPNGYGGPK